MTSTRNDRMRPWSHELNAPLRVLVTAAAGVAAALVGTFAHRMGASMNIPYGLVLAFAILGMSAWCARSRGGVTDLAVHLIVSSATAWLIAAGSAGGDVLTPAGFNTDTLPYFSQHAGYIWLLGGIVVQVALLMMPPKWFRIDAEPDKRMRTVANGVQDTTVDESAAAPHDGAQTGAHARRAEDDADHDTETGQGTAARA
ncbi:alcohol dehydrogenase [Bifidobacterium amazonense]|uniref:Alcohol dehydrogenase n=1 Tax=Bifidobacterium amazonense TaxID=2809027 RepID=A0ABS9VRQ7_9BIFI|nr:alcohol dehydrogenase [Bifidobacterium amazonense]MCH9274786.1 alcohol dehydrogenase [Bifidobacterium amazonense]